MAFDKEYPNRKDWRKPYRRRAQQCDSTCRPNGGCPYCERNRFHSRKLREAAIKEQLKELDEN
jgi:hypothetical protein